MALEPAAVASAARPARLLATALGLLSLASGGLGDVVCQSEPVASAGPEYRWPQPNPGLVAPLSASFRCDPYRQPLSGTFTGSDIVVSAPPDLVAGFNLTDARGNAVERYTLTSMQVRKPGLSPSGVNEALAHALELVLVHRETTGTGYWATVVVPVEVTADPTADVLTPLFAGALPPTEVGERLSLLGSAALPLNLAVVWDRATFSSYWVDLPTNCNGFQASSRQLMRTAALATLQSTFAYLLKAFGKAVVLPAAEPPQVTWTINACAQGGNCTRTAAVDLTASHNQALRAQSRAVAQLRASKDRMDKALQLLDNSTLGAYELALSARDALRAAESELVSARKQVERVGQWVAAAVAASWDAAAPAANRTRPTVIGSTTAGPPGQPGTAGPGSSGTSAAPTPAGSPSASGATANGAGASLLDILRQASIAQRAQPLQGGRSSALAPSQRLGKELKVRSPLA